MDGALSTDQLALHSFSDILEPSFNNYVVTKYTGKIQGQGRQIGEGKSSLPGLDCMV